MTGREGETQSSGWFSSSYSRTLDKDAIVVAFCVLKRPHLAGTLCMTNKATSELTNIFAKHSYGSICRNVFLMYTFQAL